MTEPAIHIQGLGKRFGDRAALERVGLGRRADDKVDTYAPAPRRRATQEI